MFSIMLDIKEGFPQKAACWALKTKQGLSRMKRERQGEDLNFFTAAESR